MKNDPIRTKVLSIRLIPNADRFLLKDSFRFLKIMALL